MNWLKSASLCANLSLSSLMTSNAPKAPFNFCRSKLRSFEIAGSMRLLSRLRRLTFSQLHSFAALNFLLREKKSISAEYFEFSIFEFLRFKVWTELSADGFRNDTWGFFDPLMGRLSWTLAGLSSISLLRLSARRASSNKSFDLHFLSAEAAKTTDVRVCCLRRQTVETLEACGWEGLLALGIFPFEFLRLEEKRVFLVSGGLAWVFLIGRGREVEG